MLYMLSIAYIARPQDRVVCYAAPGPVTSYVAVVWPIKRPLSGRFLKTRRRAVCGVKHDSR